jgi:hypothetical protein
MRKEKKMCGSHPFTCCKLQGRESVVRLDGRLIGVLARPASRGGGQGGERGPHGAYVHRVRVHHPGVVKSGGRHGVRVGMSRDCRRNLVSGQRHVQHVLSQAVHFPPRVVVFPFVIVVGRSAVLCFPPNFAPRLGRGRRHPGGIRFPPDVLRVGQFVILLPLHPPVLEPDFDLALGQDQRVGYFDSSATGQVAVVVELLLQLEDLVAGVGGPLPLRFHARGERSVC